MNDLLECKRLLEDFVIDNEELEILEDSLSEFNLFEAIRAVRRELRHSDFLAFLLDPRESHNLRSYPLKALLKNIVQKTDGEGISVIDVDIADLHDVVVFREWRNIDIVIASKESNLILAIENKVDSTEHSNQLERYQQIIEEGYPDYNKLYAYLTPSGEPSSSDTWTPISYTEIHDVIIRTINTVKTTIGADVLTLLEHYCVMLRRHIMTENEIAELCRKIYKKHRKALDLIYDHRPDELSERRDHLMQLIEENKELILEDSSKSYIRFVPEEWESCPDQFHGNGKWTSSKRMLMFEFQNRMNGLKLALIIGPGEPGTRKKLFQKGKDKPNVFKGRHHTLTKIYTQIYKITFLTAKDIQNLEPDQLYEKIEKRWGKIIESELPRLLPIMH